MEGADRERAYWDRQARFDPLWAILSDPSKAGRRWDLQAFLETGRREVSLLMYQLKTLGIDVARESALDFGCGVGRLTQPLATFFDQVVGIDISPEMIRLADGINRHPDRVRYVCSAGDDLAKLPSAPFSFIYSNVVLQHVEPARALQYVRELLRSTAPGGLFVFQLPSHPRPPDDTPPAPRPLPDAAYRAAVHAEPDIPSSIGPGSDLMLTASVTNISDHPWSQAEAGAIRLGNHWLSGTGHAMLVQDDARASLPDTLAPGHTCRVTFTVRAPREPGEYQLECDVVHEGLTWFADKGSTTWRTTVRVSGDVRQVEREADAPIDDVRTALALPDMASVDTPGPLPMHGIHRDEVLRAIEEERSTLVHEEIDERCGSEWVGYRYFVRRT